tara:strand:+ start:95408 stop:96574 length:1167 start_codon:yes stop_codon:yes gene_type:complete
VEVNLTIGQKIKRFRLMNDIRQEEMADQLGVSRATLINYEKGHTTINIDVLDRLKNAYPQFGINEEEVSKPKIIENNIIDFKVLFDVLYQNKRFIFFLTFLMMFFGIGLSFFFTKYYSSQISLYPAKKDLMQGLGQFQSLAVGLGMSSPTNNQDFNIPDVVKSRLIANKVLDQQWINQLGIKTTLIDLWGMEKAPWHNFFSNHILDSALIKDKAINEFHDRIEVLEDRLSGLIRINLTLEDPLISATVANFIGEQVQNYIQKENSAQSTKEKIFIISRLTIVKNELEASELELKSFKERNRGYEDSPDLFMTFSQLYREVEAKKQVYLTLQQQLELARIEEVKQTPILHVLDRAVPPSKKSSPNRIAFMIGFALLGMLFSTFRTVFIY